MTPMSIAKRRQLARVREAEIWRLCVEEGLSSREAASRLGMSHTGVSKALRRIEARAILAVDSLAKGEKVRQLDRLRFVYAEAVAAWKKSKGDRSTRRSRQTDTAGGTMKLAEVRTEEQRGDPRFLDVARGAMADVRRLLGLERVTVEHTHQTDRPAADLTDAELDVKLAEFALEHQRKAGGGDRPH
jgi:predicted DNA-binding protein (UPF0251 family)